MAAKLKSNQTVVATINRELRTITYRVVDSELPDIVQDFNSVHWDIILEAAYRGMQQQRIIDAAAIVTIDGESKKDRAVRKHAAMSRLVAHYATGTDKWDMPRVEVDRTPKPDPLDLILEAIMRAYNWDAATTQLKLAAMVKARGGDLEAHARLVATSGKVAPVLALIKAERLKPVADADTMSDELENLDIEEETGTTE